MAKEYLDRLSAFIAGIPGLPDEISLECKHFFSGAVLYAGDRVCLSLTPVGLAIKLPAETRNRLLNNKEAVPLRYFPSAPIKKDYALLPDADVAGSPMKSGETLNNLVKQSIEYVFKLPKQASAKVVSEK